MMSPFVYAGAYLVWFLLALWAVRRMQGTGTSSMEVAGLGIGAVLAAVTLVAVL